MNLLSGISRQHVVIGLLCTVLSAILVAIPPMDLAGVSVWLYLAPALFAAYCIPLSLLAVLIITGSVLSLVLIGHGAESFVSESIASSVFLIALAAWRQFTGRTDTLLIATNLLLFVAFPIDALLNYYWADYTLQHSLLGGSRYALSSLLAVLIAELVAVAVALSRGKLLESLRDILGFRPSLVHVVELIIGTAVAVSFFLTLGLFWQTWDESLTDSIRKAGDVRFDTLFVTAEASTTERLQLASRVADRSLAEDDADTDALIAQLRRLLSSGAQQAAAGTPVEIALGSRAYGIIHSSKLESSTAERAFALARAQVTSGLVSLDLRMPSGELRQANILIATNEYPDILVLHPDLAAAVDFAFAPALEYFKTVYADPVRVINGPGTGVFGRFKLPENAQVVEESDLGWVIWREPGPAGERAPRRSRLQNISEDTLITMAPHEESLRQFSAALHGVQGFRVTMDYWRFFSNFTQAITVSTTLGLVILAVLLWFSRFMVGGLVRPLGELTTVFESWRQFRGGELGSGAALQAMDARGFSSLEDIHSLQVGFRSLAQDVMYGERRLSTIAANYDELLRSLPLGVLAVDGASRVQFLNDALGEITEQRQDAIARLKAQAAQMLATNTTVDEWQLNLEDRPPKSLLLVVNHRLDDRGQESGLWVIATDLTEQKQTNAQLIQASKLATLGEMSTGMAHELNQPLNVISLATSNLRFSIKKGKATPDNTMSKLDRIDGAVHRAASIIDHMRAYGRLAGEGLSEINVGEIVQGSCNLLSEQLKLANITLTNDVPEDGLVVKGNAIQLEQVLINLINNAKDAIREHKQPGEITVDSEVAGGRVLLRVTDTGGGIPDHVLPHIFEPFFTTKPVGKGTGLGGSISYGIVREMQGDIWAENVPGGAQITISLPLLRNANAVR